MKKSKFDSNFTREQYDFYRTFDTRCHSALCNVLSEPVKYVEPCVGIGDLVDGLKQSGGHECTFMSDLIERKHTPSGTIFKNALDLTEKDCNNADYIITNPPWERKLLHQMIEKFITLKPTWLLFDSDWANTKQASNYIQEYCEMIVVIGRVQWIEHSKHGSLKDCSWYLFNKSKTGDTIFVPRYF